MRLPTVIALLVLLPLAALPVRGAEEPEAVYAKFHRAVIAGNLDEMLKYGPAPRRAEMHSMSDASREAALKMAQFMMPRAFTLQRKTVQANGRATLIVSGPWAGEGQKLETMYGIVRMVTENNEWKIDGSNWSNEKPPNLAAPNRAAPPSAADKAAPKTSVAAKGAAAVKDAAAGSGAPVVGSTSSATPGRTLGAAKPPCVYKPVMTAVDIENCK
ncbi:MAG: hypothetical protein EXR33_00385 [Betaproteobacteria bacterium]|nr:hypothetical protein [Betaproteobacteria bacterium]